MDHDVSHARRGTQSLLDTDLSKLTMQCAVLKCFPDVRVAYALKNRTPEMKFTRAAFHWIQKEIAKLGQLVLSQDEMRFLRQNCPFMSESYLSYLEDFQLDPSQIVLTFQPVVDMERDSDRGVIDILIEGLWVETMLFEVPLLSLLSETYFRFVDIDWTHKDQEEKAYSKGKQLMKAGCIFAEYGTRRRRDYHTQELVVRGLVRAQQEGDADSLPGRLSGTSNVWLAMKYGLTPKGTVGHEWFMGVAALEGSYETCTETALSCWLDCFGDGIWKVVPTDTLGTPFFLKSFRQKAVVTTRGPPNTAADPAADEGESTLTTRRSTETFAEAFDGVRQDSGDPIQFIQTMKAFYDDSGIRKSKTIVFSDSLRVEDCLEYRKIAERAGFEAAFGIGTSFTNDFDQQSTGRRSPPLNIVLKLKSVEDKPAIKLGDNVGKNSGDDEVVERVKRQLGYVEKPWAGGDESARW